MPRLAAYRNWSGERLALVDMLLESATAEQMARVAHLFLLEKLQVAHMAKLAEFNALAGAAGDGALQ